MNSPLSSLVLLILCAVVATILTRSMRIESAMLKHTSIALIWVVLFASHFFGAIFFLGYVSLFSGIPVVKHGYAAGIMILVLAIVILRRSSARLLLWKNRGKGIDKTEKRTLFILPGNRRSNGTTIVTVCVFTLIGLMVAAGYPQGYESKAYHLPIALHFLQSQSLGFWDTVFIHTHNANASIIYAVLLNFVSEHLMAAAPMVFLIPLVLAVYGLCRATSADPSASLFAASGILTVPMIALAADKAAADVAGVAFIGVSTYFVLAAPKQIANRELLGGLAAGLAFGFKSLHLIPIGFLTVILFWRSYRSKSLPEISDERNIWRIFREPTIFFVSATIISSFWIVRNYLQFGNPLYPVYVSELFDLLGWPAASDMNYGFYSTVQDFWVRSSLEWLVYPWIEWHYAENFYNNNSGLGLFFAATIPVALFMAVLCIIRTEGANKPLVSVLFGGGLFVCLVWFVLGNRQPKYALVTLVFWFPLIAWCISCLERKLRALYEPLVVICILFMLFVFFSRHLINFGDEILYAGMTTRSVAYQYPRAVDRLPAGSTIVNLFDRPHNYLLAGEMHRNKVISYVRSVRAFGVDAPMSHVIRVEDVADGFRLVSKMLRSLGATHLFVSGNAKVVLDSDVTLVEIDKMLVNPFNGVPLKSPRYLYQINY